MFINKIEIWRSHFKIIFLTQSDFYELRDK